VAAVAALIGWLVVAPGSWWWAVGDGDVVRGWDRSAATAVAAAAVVVLGAAAWRLRAAGDPDLAEPDAGAARAAV
jgi:hypothetical protein